ncbi:NADH-quinone oxidoreductase subunit C [Streptomyces sp. NPDC049555]|uniref:NADH-quinone oxidoreductase subunit C n=1 Tax=Streptomyces sp. NPDC049555 TaxID=3154930 RepID=UPI00341B4EAD
MSEPTVGWLPRGATDLFGEGATAEEAYDLLTVDVPAEAWLPALTTARDALGCTFFDWLSAVDEPGTGLRISAHVAALPAQHGGAVHRLLLRTTVPHDAATLPTATGVYAGAAWHERETHEMFGIDFAGHPHLEPLLLPDGFEGHPLRKDFVLAARVVKAWPGAKEPGESAEGGPKRRQMLPPGVPDPNEWGPLKGQLPPAPTRPERRAPSGDRATPPRRARSVSEGSASQAAPRRARSAAEGSASQAPAAPRRTRSAADGSASQAAPRSASEGAAPAPRSSDAPWHHARPAFDEPAARPAEPPATPDTRPEPTGPAEPTDGAAAPSRRDGAQPESSGPAESDAPQPSGEGTPASGDGVAPAQPTDGAAAPSRRDGAQLESSGPAESDAPQPSGDGAAPTPRRDEPAPPAEPPAPGDGDQPEAAPPAEPPGKEPGAGPQTRTNPAGGESA